MPAVEFGLSQLQSALVNGVVPEITYISTPYPITPRASDEIFAGATTPITDIDALNRLSSRLQEALSFPPQGITPARRRTATDFAHHPLYQAFAAEGAISPVVWVFKPPGRSHIDLTGDVLRLYPSARYAKKVQWVAARLEEEQPTLKEADRFMYASNAIRGIIPGWAIEAPQDDILIRLLKLSDRFQPPGFY